MKFIINVNTSGRTDGMLTALLDWKLVLLTKCILALSTVVSGQKFGTPTYKGSFPYSRCTQTRDVVSCVNLNLTRGTKELSSHWPPGPYALPLSRTGGCPETRLQGWRKGQIEVKTESSNKRLRMYFCSKIRNDQSLDKGEWIPGPFGVFKMGDSCPKGFDEQLQAATLLPRGVVTSSTHAPKYITYHNNTGNSSIVFHICQRTISQNSSVAYGPDVIRTDFTVLKIVDKDCPAFDTEYVNLSEMEGVLGFHLCSYTMRVIDESDITVARTGPQVLTVGTTTTAQTTPVTVTEWLFTNTGEVKSTTTTAKPELQRHSITESEFILNTTLASGTLQNPDGDGKFVSWYQLRMKRTLTLLKLTLQFLYGGIYRAWEARNDFVRCFFDDIKWSFLEGGAMSCGNQTNTNGVKELVVFDGKIHARFVTLVFEEAMLNSLNEGVLWIQFLNKDIFNHCNEDLGMNDWTILDSQISASSFVREHETYHARPRGTGWCPAESDTKPWIMIDLIGITIVEGLTVWSTHDDKWESTNVDCPFFCLYYGLASNDLTQYNDSKFERRTLIQAEHDNTFMFLNPIETQFVKLEFHNGVGCVQLELHGCNYAGTPSYNCSNATNMFEIKTTPDIRNAMPLDVVATLDECKTACLMNKNCSVMKFDGTCIYFPQDSHRLKHYDEVKAVKKSTILAKLCNPEPMHLLPTIIYGTNEITTNVASISDNAVITSLRYPFPYGSGENYKWLIQFPESRFIRIVFMFVDLGYLSQECFDSVVMASSMSLGTKGKPIDYRFNGMSPVIVTDYNLLVMSFISCLQSPPSLHKGFRAVITGEIIPSCMSTTSDMFSGAISDGICDKSEMYLSSMTYLNQHYDKSEEWWHIRSKRHGIAIHILYFNVACKAETDTDEDQTSFTIFDGDDEQTYCNTNLRAEAIYPRSRNIDVFYRRYQKFTQNFMKKEGFRFRYTTIIRFTEKDYIRKSKSKVCSPQLGKCYFVRHGDNNWNAADTKCKNCSMELFSSQNSEELAFVKYLISERWFKYDSHHLNVSDHYFQSHIGLKRKDGGTFLWNDGSLLIFNAWKPGHPQLGKDCVRTTFDDFGNETFISEYCDIDIATYYVCQSVGHTDVALYDKDTDDECFCPYNWIEFAGHCYYPTPEIYNSYLDLSGFGRQTCRDIDSTLATIENEQELLWLFYELRDSDKAYQVEPITTITSYNVGFKKEGCSTIFPHKRYWKKRVCNNYLDIGFICEKEVAAFQTDTCEDNVHTEATLNVTYSGRACHNWNELTSKEESDYLSRFPSESKIPDRSDNICIDPSGSGILWCYTSGPNIWEPCIYDQSIIISHGDDVTKSDDYQYKCNDGRFIQQHQRCNGVFDCIDFSDEINCFIIPSHNVTVYLNETTLERFETVTRFLCGSSEWITILAVCDGNIQCRDASDEIGCSTANSGQHLNNTCTGDYNTNSLCRFGTEFLRSIQEMRAPRLCASYEFTCDSGQCILLEEKCDGIKDCYDESDENKCSECTDSLHCDRGKCVPFNYLCDEYTDCEDGRDEISCAYEAPASYCDLIQDQSGLRLRHADIEGLTIECDILLDRDVVIYLRYNVEVDIQNKTGRLFLRSKTDGEIGITERKFQDILYEDTEQCVLEISSSCQLGFVVGKYTDIFSECPCIVDVYDVIYKESLYISYIKNHSSLCDGTKLVAVLKDRYFSMTSNGHLFFNTMEDSPLDLTAEIKCVSKEQHTNEFTTRTGERCKRCVYGGAKAKCGNDHLQHCALFSCPHNTIKCSNSYCIPIDLVCNYDLDCPDGSDEHNCYCEKERRVIYIMVEDDPSALDMNAALEDLVRQFYTIQSDIRILYYTTSTPLYDQIGTNHRLLEIREKTVNLVRGNNHVSDCIYNTMAKHFLGRISSALNGNGTFIFIEDSIESKEVAKLMFNGVTKIGFDMYRVVISELQNNNTNPFSVLKDIRITNWRSLHIVGHMRFTRICKARTEVPCEGGYRCSSSKQCLSLDKVCDGVPQCIGSDDEFLCDLYCPRFCKCTSLSISCIASGLTDNSVMMLSRNTRWADLSNNPDLNLWKPNVLRFPFIQFLNLSYCGLRRISKDTFNHVGSLRTLDLSYNKLTTLPDEVFTYLSHLINIYLDGNFELRSLSATAFQKLHHLTAIKITKTQIKLIFSYTFRDLTLKSLDISDNLIEEIEDNAFVNVSVESFYFSGNNLKQFKNNIFAGLNSMKVIRSPVFRYCCVRPCYVAESECYPHRDEFSSCEDLMRHPVLQAVLWIVGLTALLGNLFSIIYRVSYDRNRLKIAYGIFVSHLAAADFLMGVYLMIIAIADTIFRNRYIFVDEEWRNSNMCVVAGILSTVSSEASVLFVCLITLDRLLVIKYPSGSVSITPKRAHVCSIVSWVIAFVLAIVPVVYTSFFMNKFYSRSAVCIALPLTAEKPPGWVYSVCIFIGLNFCTFVLVAFGQLSIFKEIKKSEEGDKTMKEYRKRDLRVARNLILIATTDFLCWFPIGIMGIMALNGYPITGDVYAWTAVFLLPFNSAINPVMYTLSAILGKESFKPSIDEQRRIDLKMEIGKLIVDYADLQNFQHVKKDIQELKSVREMTTDGVPLTTDNVISTSLQMTMYLCVLHQSAICLERLTPDNTYLTIPKRRKTAVKVVFDSKMHVTKDNRDMAADVYRFGIILQMLMDITKGSLVQKKITNKD